MPMYKSISLPYQGSAPKTNITQLIQAVNTTLKTSWLTLEIAFHIGKRVENSWKEIGMSLSSSFVGQ